MWDSVYAWLLGFLPTISGLSTDTVFDGAPLTQDQLLTYAVLGDEDPAGFAEEDATEPIDALVGEAGEIVIRFVSRSGDNDALATHRATTKAWVDALRVEVKPNQTLNGILAEGSWVSVGRSEPRMQKTPNGSRVERVVTLRYFTRL